MKEWTADDEYIRGKRDIMLEMAKADLEELFGRPPAAKPVIVPSPFNTIGII